MSVAYQLPLFADELVSEARPRLKGIVNVASVPQRSPFRYPGGKTWLVPHIRRWLGQRATRPQSLIEPFAGGGIVGLTAAFERLAEHVTLVELDENIAAVWQTMLDGGAEWLADRIVSFDLTEAAVRSTLAQAPADTRERAFATILKNRVNRGGIMAPGASLVKHGEAGRGLASRWYPDTLKMRILAIAAIRDRITFIRGDGLVHMREHAYCPDTVYFIDPPYTAGRGKRAGSRLYSHSSLDHAELFRIAATLRGDFLMTYDDAGELRELARRHSFDTELVPMKNTHHAEMCELLIGRDLAWARR
jgi:DNA adenine methylase